MAMLSKCCCCCFPCVLQAFPAGAQRASIQRQRRCPLKSHHGIYLLLLACPSRRLTLCSISLLRSREAYKNSGFHAFPHNDLHGYQNSTVFEDSGDTTFAYNADKCLEVNIDSSMVSMCKNSDYSSKLLSNCLHGSEDHKNTNGLLDNRASTSGRCYITPHFSSRTSRFPWFPYMDKFKIGNTTVSSAEIIKWLDPYIENSRKMRMRHVASNRTYSICLVVEGLTDFGNVSAVFRTADALGFQSVHVVSNDNSKRYKQNRNVSMGSEKWLDIELWESTRECFNELRSRGYRIAVTHVAKDAVPIHNVRWTCPIAIVLGNELMGISSEALELADMKCSIPMTGMVDSFNVSVAAGIFMHTAVCERISVLGSHGDLNPEQCQILVAEFYLRHKKNMSSILDHVIEN